MKLANEHQFTFVTSNDLKVHAAKVVCEEYGMSFDRQVIDFVEIQADEGELIARDKLAQAYQQLQKPVAVTDDSWLFPGLGGFPGAYMKQVNDWFSVEDWLRLTTGLGDRRVILRQIVGYQDAQRSRLFTVDIEGIILPEASGTCASPHFSIISFDNGQHSAAEMVSAGKPAIKHLKNSWHDLCEWLQTDDS